MPDLGAYLWPDSVAIIGASDDTTGIRGRLTNVVLQHAFAGEVHLVSRSTDTLFGRRTFKSISDVPGEVDLALIAIPAQFVADELERCAGKGVRAVQVVSSGFAETHTDEGAALQERLVAIAKRNDIVLAGPNCQGFANIGNRLFATFSRVFDDPQETVLPESRQSRPSAIVSQSGAIGNAFFHHARKKELPIGFVATTGNEAALELFDIVEGLVDRGDVSSIMVMMEDVKTPATFIRASEKAALKGIPIIVLKIGKSGAGERAAASHTAALAGSYAGVQAMFRKYGIIEADDIGEATDIAAGFSHFGDRLPKGNRVAIVTGSGGAGGMMADAAELAGLEVPTLDNATRAKFDAIIPDYGTSQNPVDATATALRAVGYPGLISTAAASPVVDGIFALASARVTGSLAPREDELTDLSRRLDKPVFFWTYNVPIAESRELLSRAGYPLYVDLRNAARTMKVLADYRSFRAGFVDRSGAKQGSRTERDAAAALLSRAGTVLTEADARPVLAAYGICDGDVLLATSAEEAVTLSASCRGPVALKVQSPDVLHKSDAGAVVLNVPPGEAAAKAYDQIVGNARTHHPEAALQGVLVQPMAPKGIEVILGVSRDPVFGPQLMVGLGGILVEVLKDVAFAPVPMTKGEALDLLKQLRGYPILEGVRGAGPADVDALADVMVRLARFAADFAGDVTEIDLNPVLVHPRGEGVSIADALIVREGDGD